MHMQQHQHVIQQHSQQQNPSLLQSQPQQQPPPQQQQQPLPPQIPQQQHILQSQQQQHHLQPSQQQQHPPGLPTAHHIPNVNTGVMGQQDSPRSLNTIGVSNSQPQLHQIPQHVTGPPSVPQQQFRSIPTQQFLGSSPVKNLKFYNKNILFNF